jgi:hypothetical protein
LFEEMKRFWRFVCCVGGCMAATGWAQVFTPEEAGKIQGIELQVQGKVAAMGFTKAKSGNWYHNLFFGDDTPRHVFRVRYRMEGLPGQDLLPDGLTLREVRVRGVVESAADGSRITVTDGSQIEVLPVDVEAVLRMPVDSEAERGLWAVAWRQVLMSGDYAALEKKAEELRAKDLRFQCGIWQLPVFMGALSKPERGLEADWQAHLTALEEWGSAFPESVTQRLVLGSYHIYAAWKIRGSGYASSVTKEGWKGFHEGLLRAQSMLEKLPRADWSPYAYQRWITLAMGRGLSTEEVRVIFEEGIGRWPEYHELYVAEAVRLLPRWRGRPGDWERWLAEVTEPETELGDELYARVTWAQSVYYKNQKGVFEGAAADWGRVKRGFDVMRKRFPDSLWNLNAYARFAAYAADRAVARELLKELEGHEMTSFWSGWSNYEVFVKWAQ